MKTAKLVIGILSMVLFLVIVLQSCIVGVGNVLVENDEISGSAGVFLAICMLVAGIVGLPPGNILRAGSWQAAFIWSAR